VTAEDLPDLDAECFFIAPIGAEGSDTRERSDGVLEYIVAPAAADVALTAIRADKIAKPGQITRQVIEHVVAARAAVVDLTDANPNVYYEMAVRHTAQLPTVLIAQEGEKLPFDISQMRTIFFDHTSLKSAAECRAQITQHLKEALAGEVDSPIAASVSVQRLEQGTAQERVLAQLVDGLDEVRERLRNMDAGNHRGVMSRRARHDLERRFAALRRARHSGDPRELDEAIHGLERPLSYLIEGSDFWPRDRSLFAERELARQADHDAELEAAREAGREAERDAERSSERNAERQAELEAERQQLREE
jgi:hypothetical protein